MPYDLLRGVRVLEVALLAPDALGGHLADLGAEVVKVESLGGGDHVRRVGAVALGASDGPGFLHLNWNRGKKSVALDLKSEAGRRIFLDLAARSHVVIDGLRAGTMEEWGLGFAALRMANPRIVVCSLSGLGRTGPLRRLASHGLFFDAYAGFVPAEERPDGSVRPSAVETAGAGYQAGGLWAATAVLAALSRAERTGEAALVEVAEAEVAVYWRWMEIEAELNAPRLHRRTKGGPGASLAESVRCSYYRTSDDRLVVFMAMEGKFWHNFLRAVGREDLKTRYPTPNDYDHQVGDEGLRRELVALFRTRTQREWIELFIAANVPGGPVNRLQDILTDAHFVARQNVYEVVQPEVGPVRLLSSPIKVEGQVFDQGPAPLSGQHTHDVLAEILGYDAARLAELAGARVIGARSDDARPSGEAPG